jgi:alanine racemase
MKKSGSAVHPTHAVIDLHAFRHNLETVRTIVGAEVGILAVVKSNGYGHGVVAVAEEAVRFGVDRLAVARIDEGCELRAEGISHPTLVFEAAPPDLIPTALAAKLELSVPGVHHAKRIHDAAVRAGVTAPVHVKVDTGMGRLGIPFEVAASLVEQIARLPGLEIVGIYSHFATADEADQTYARMQLGRFQRVLEELGKKKIEIPLRHMANTAAIMTLPDSHFNLVRPGIMLYGLSSRRSNHLEEQLRPVMSLQSWVAQVKTVEAGTSISYGRRYTACSPTCIATVPIGYADGYPRSLGNRATVLIRGTRYPVVGTICMDHLMVDVGPGADIQEGDVVTLIGRNGGEYISCWEVADLLGTVPYEVMCGVSARVPRIQVGRTETRP